MTDLGPGGSAARPAPDRWVRRDAQGGAAALYRALKVFLILMLFGIMLTPSLTISLGLPKVRLEELLIGVLFVYLAVIALAGQRIEYAWGMRQTMLLAFPLFIFISISVGLALGYGGSLGDLNQLIRVIKYLVIYTVTVSVIALSPEPEETKISIMSWTLVFGCLLALVTIQQYFDLLGLNARYVPYVDQGRHSRLLLELGRGRPVGMIGNPNELGFLFAVAAIVAMYRLLSRLGLFYLIALALSVIGLLMSGSRTSLVAGLAGFLVLGLVMAWSRMPAKVRFLQRGAVVLGALLLLATVGAGAATNVYDDLLERFETLTSPQDDPAWQARLERWEENIELFQASPVVGVGPLRRGSLDYAADNEWWLLLRSYGLVGTVYLVALFVLPMFRGRSDRTKALTIAILVCTALYMIPAVVFHSLALMPLVLILIALSDTTVRKKVLV